ncbi:MAG: Bax inhibitor-1/YccA family protein [Elusimicrobia bacterium]|nr:Bax inhibitor-1/YccA family protein [Elusimicrobiota bacterium]
MLASSNPVMNEKAFAEYASWSREESMTINGTINKTFALLFLTVLGAMLTWRNPASFAPWMLPCIIVSLGVAVALAFKRTWAPFLAPVYALCQGVFLGAVSSMMNAAYPGIVGQAVLGTFTVMFVMLGAYRVGWLRATPLFTRIIALATMGIFLVYMVNMVMGMFGKQMAFITASSPLGIVFSLFVCGLAAFNFIMDFHMIEQGAQAGAPKYMEWYGAFGLMVTLIWLYIEILRLLSKLQSRRD